MMDAPVGGREKQMPTTSEARNLPLNVSDRMLMLITSGSDAAMLFIHIQYKKKTFLHRNLTKSLFLCNFTVL